jgi:curved DNA-binding protein CbpA
MGRDSRYVGEMSAPLKGNFQDHYQVLGVEPRASSEVIQKAYTSLAARYSPKNRETADPEKFKAVNYAYEVLADPVSRKMFDDLRPRAERAAAPKFTGQEFFDAVDGEAQRRICLLCLLYDQRRHKPVTGSLSLRDVESLMAVQSEQLQLTIWYLKQRGYVVSDDKSSMQITVDGMDYLEQNLPSADSLLALLKSTAEPAPEAEKAKV